MTPDEVRAFNAGVEAVRQLARDKIAFWRAKMRKTGFLVDKWIVGATWVERDAAALLRSESTDNARQGAPR